MSKQIQENFLADGYFIAKQIVNEKKIEHVLETLFKIYCKYNPSTKLLGLQNPWQTNMFHEELLEFRQREPEKFSLLYASAQTSSPVIELVSDHIIVEYSANLLGTRNTELSISEGMIRMDAPSDKRNISGWHQEISYLRNNGLVVWIPLSDITQDLGRLQICPKSHHEGELKVVRNHNTPSDTSTVAVDEIKPEYIAKYSKMYVDIKRGDALFFDTRLFHKSGVNNSNLMRFSCQTRFSIITEKDFVPFRETKTYKKSVVDEVAIRHPAFSNNIVLTDEQAIAITNGANVVFTQETNDEKEKIRKNKS